MIHSDLPATPPDNGHEPSLDADRLMQQSDVVLHLGRLMLAAGAGSYYIRFSMARAASAVGLDRHEATVTMAEIVTSSYVGNRSRTETCEVRRVGVNVGHLEALRRIVHDPRARETVEHLEAKLQQVEKMHAHCNTFTNAAASGVACAGFCFLSKDGWVECLTVLVAAFLGQFVRRQMLERHYQHFLTWLVCGVTASGTYMSTVIVLNATGAVAENHQGGIISAILFPVPGFPMVTAMLDLFRQDFSSALSRSAYVLMVMAAAGVAVWTMIFVFRWDVAAASGSTLDGPLLYVLRCFCPSIAAYRFAILFNAGMKASMLAAVVGALANTGRLLLIDVLHVSWQLAVGLAAVTIGLLAQLFVSRASLSWVAFSVPAAVIMIPGVLFYRTISALNTFSVDELGVGVGKAVTSLVEVFFVITAIGVGLALARIITDHNWRHDVATSGRITLPRTHVEAVKQPLED